MKIMKCTAATILLPGTIDCNCEAVHYPRSYRTVCSITPKDVHLAVARACIAHKSLRICERCGLATQDS